MPKVFPGGNYDAKQDENLRMTAIRETFEESGLLIASPSEDFRANGDSESLSLSGTTLDNARHLIHDQKCLFRDFLKEHSLRAEVDSLYPFTQWITPVFVPRSADRHCFLLYALLTM